MLAVFCFVIYGGLNYFYKLCVVVFPFILLMRVYHKPQLLNLRL
jgi:hypothetical protein